MFDAEETLDLATRLTICNDASEVSRLVADYAARLLNADRVSVGLLVPDEPGRYEVVALAGQEGELRRGGLLHLDDLAVRDAVESRAPLSFLPAERTEADAVALVAMGMQRCMLVPLLSGSRCMGTLNVATRSAPIDGPLAERLGRLLGSQLDRITARATLQQQLESQRRESRRWTLLRNLELELTSAASVEAVLQAVRSVLDESAPALRLAFVELNADKAVLWLPGREPAAVAPDDPAYAALFDGLGPGTSHYVPDLAAEPIDVPAQLRGATRAVLRVSVDGRHGAMGAIVVASDESDGIELRDREMLSVIATMVGGALERIEVDERLAISASHDQLTGLIRREGFDKLLDAEVEGLRGGAQTSAVVSIDVDRFKVVNDTEGHLGGDEFLVELAARLTRVLGPDDVATRVGADEFVVLLRGGDRHAYAQACARMVLAVNQWPFYVGDRALVGSISVGFVVIDAATASGREAIALADAACYAAKIEGGNRAKAASPHDSGQSARRTASQTLLKIRRALEEDRLRLLAQPIYEIGDKQLFGFEVLVRMQDNDGELIAPDKFLPIAERYHAIADLDAWVVQRALNRLNRCAPDAGDPPRLFINVSPTSITSTGFTDRVQDIIAASAVRADRLCFEITETGTMKSFDEALSFVNRVSELGALVALDDFGVGLSSLSHLQSLPIDVLKIDGSIVAGLEHGGVNATMVSTIQALAEALGIVTIAEFVETSAAVSALAEIGVHCGQGYWFGRPQPLCDQLTTVGFAPVD